MEHTQKTSILSEDPPAYAKHDWRHAEEFWEARESKSPIQRWKMSICIDVAFLKSAHRFSSPQSFRDGRINYLQAKSRVRCFRQEIKERDLSYEDIKPMKMSVYGEYAKVMNLVEAWTGE
ncbi:hypothetical protein N7478_001373 [Penicillium angulare]|uniref:uncharacterized protein n=1 Tax=Penicillium angulare TaxID=116970 RepID=UPI002541E2EC|nr:uncharacterized protein N7478_001373 [Penicillium angulare]KAJ5292122.1 hypothetical protein N7478_001373 [Penicillium angulare]